MFSLVLLCVVVVAVARIAVKVTQSPVDGGLGCAQQDALFTPAGRSFLGVLEL